MSFGTGLSGLNASARSLDVIGHNIANANTTGMKASRAEFAEVYAASLGAAGGSTGGIGVSLAAVTQLFTQGNLKVTGNNLDMAINGEGFFNVLATDGSTAYTRNGEFKLDRDGFIVTNAGSRLQGYLPDSPGGPITQGRLSNLKLPTGASIDPKVTTEIEISANLDAAAPVQPPVTTTSPTSDPAELLTPEQKLYGTSLNLYDTKGNAIPVQLYFVRANDTSWSVVGQVINRESGVPTQFNAGSVEFGPDGKPLTATIAVPPIAANAFTAGVPALETSTLPVQVGDATSGWTLTNFGSPFAVYDLKQDGYSAGELTSISISEDGIIKARYSNGTSQDAGQVALTRFRNVQGLQPINGGYWQETAASGDPTTGAPQAGRFGSVRSGALEESNVDMTQELVNMIVAQRSYQANAQTIKTQDQVLQTLVNLR